MVNSINNVKVYKNSFLMIFIGIILYGIISNFSNISDFSSIFRKLNFINIIILLFLTTVNYLLRFVKWRIGSYRHQIPIHIDAIIYFSGFLFSLTPSKIGETARGYLINKLYPNIKTSIGVSLTIVDRVSDIMGLIVLSLIGGFILNIQYVVEISIVIISLLLLVYLFISNPLSIKISKGSKLKKNKITKLSNELWQQISNFGFRKFLLLILISIISWSFEGLALYFIFIFFSLNINVIYAILIFSIGTIIGAVTFLPGGLGSTELSLISLIVIFTNISQNVAVSITFIIRVVTLWFGIAFGLLNYIIYTFLLLAKKNNM